MVQVRLFANPAIHNRLFPVFTCFTILAVILRYCFFDSRDPSKCGALMNEGIWLDHPPANTTIPTEWQPPGCMANSYKRAEISACLYDRRLIFAGDSTIREIFWGVAKKLDKDADSSQAEKHANITLVKHGVKLEFIWDPYLNSSRVRKELDLFDGKRYYQKDPDRPAVMLMGTGLWYSRFESVNSMKKWKDNIDDVAKHMRIGRKTTDLTRQDLVLLAPVAVPAWWKLSDDRRKTITPERIEEMNLYLQQLSDVQGIDVMWAFNQMTKDLPQTYGSSGIHVEESIAAKQAEILLNLRCNGEIEPKYPYDKTCCMKYEQPNYQQWIGLFLALAVLPVISHMRSKAEAKITKPAGWLPSEKTTNALFVFGLAVAYCFYADRTLVFNKFHKHYDNLVFFAVMVVWLAAGFYSVKQSSTTASDQPFMFRDQTDEWKGWLQFIILVYHYTGASKVAWIYGIIRVAVASYLFMTGYGHTIYFYKKGDYSFKRVGGVLIRLNLLSCVLPYMMKTEYIFYYFAPLVSFWFIIVYFTMFIGAKYNKNTRFLLGKIAISAILTTALITASGFLEVIFKIFHVLANTEWNVEEFRFRVFLDMWIVFIGMVTAIVYIKLSDNASPYTTSFHIMRKYALIASAIALPIFFLFQITRETKFVYNAYHPYLSWIPILSFIVLRNATPRLRNSYSGVFAWLGKCSLETFTLQFHIWMAADTRGLLDLSLFSSYPGFGNFFVVTTLFIYTSHCVAGATGDLTAWIMGAEKAPPQSLPITQTEVATKEGDDQPDEIRLQDFGERTNENGKASDNNGEESFAAFFGDFKVRCAAILVGMWVLNMTYNP